MVLVLLALVVVYLSLLERARELPLVERSALKVVSLLVVLLLVVQCTSVVVKVLLGNLKAVVSLLMVEFLLLKKVAQ